MSFVLKVIPGRETTRSQSALASMMQNLAPDTRNPVALEIWSEASHEQCFCVRAPTAAALTYVEQQLRARYPQARFEPLADEQDVLRPGKQEAVSALILGPGSGAYLPLRAWEERDLEQEGVDPVLGLLASMRHLPPGYRAVAQLCLAPTSAVWGQAQSQQEMTAALEAERYRRAFTTPPGSLPAGAGNGSIIAGTLLLLAVGLLHRFGSFLPAWIGQDASLLLHTHRLPTFTPPQIEGMVFWLLAIVVGYVGLLWCFHRVLRPLRLRRQRYDQRLELLKAGQLTYHVKLRLFVIGAIPPHAAEGEERIPTAPLSWELGTLRVALLQAAIHWQSARAEARMRHDVLFGMAAAYRQYHQNAGGMFAAHRLWSARRYLAPSGWQRGVRRSAHYLSVTDVAALWRLPQAMDLPELPLMEHTRARSFLVPSELSRGVGQPIGFSQHAGYRLPVYLPDEVKRTNLFAIGATGKGKSTLFQHVCAAVLRECAWVSEAPGRKGSSLLVMEPHGDLIAAVLRLIPHALYDQVVLIDLADALFPPAINLLDASISHDRDKVVSTLITIFKKIWEGSFGPRIENVLEFSMKALLEANEAMIKRTPEHEAVQYTILDVMSMLREAGFRKRVLREVTDQEIVNWFKQNYEPLLPNVQDEIVVSVMSKMSKFSATRRVRRIVGQPSSSLDFTQVIQEGKIVLINTASGVVGEDISALLGATLLGLFQAALGEQAPLAAAQRQQYLLVIDEFQTYHGTTFNLAQLRKFGAAYALATQSLTTLNLTEQTLRSTVLTNMSHLVAFNMSNEDAKLLTEMLDTVTVSDLMHLDDVECYARLSLRGQRLPTFSCNLSFCEPLYGAGQAAQLREDCQKRDGRPVQDVEDHLATLTRRRAAKGKELENWQPPGSAQQQTRTRGTRGHGGKKSTEEQAELAEPPEEEGSYEG